MSIDSPVMIAGVIVAVIAIGTGAWYLWQRRRTEELRALYGSEYSRTVDALGDRRRGEAELLKRRDRVEHFEIRALTVGQRQRFVEKWRDVQSRFVDDPKGAMTDADWLVENVMQARGYPLAEFDQRAADLSVHHGRVVENYRAARDIARRHHNGEATTEDLRQAMVYYRSLFTDLLEDREHVRRALRDRAVERAVVREDVRSADRAAARRAEQDSELNP
jgi:hypothetical protein